jgi:hypothetical protein
MDEGDGNALLRRGTARSHRLRFDLESVRIPGAPAWT